jgi:hypothetical protein
MKANGRRGRARLAPHISERGPGLEATGAPSRVVGQQRLYSTRRRIESQVWRRLTTRCSGLATLAAELDIVRPRKLMVMLPLISVISLLVSAASAPSPVKPALPYLDWGACPFECCVYSNWTAVRRTDLLSARRAGASVAFQLKAGERAYAVTGVVVTSRPGRVEILEPITLGQEPNVVSLHPGDLIFTLHYKGEGYDLFWFNGRTYSDQIHWDGIGIPPGVTAFRVLEQPTTVWWVKIRNKSGLIGWSRTPEDFTDNDACG